MQTSHTKQTSYTRIERYRRCPTAYHHHYVLKTQVDGEAGKESLTIGRLQHLIIERHLLSLGNATQEISTQNRTIDRDIITKSIDEFLEQELPSMDIFMKDSIFDVIEKCGELLYRASDRCKDPKLQLRKADGGLLYNPLMGTSFKSAVSKAGIKNAIRQIDTYVHSINPRWSYDDNSSLVWTLGKVASVVNTFKIPKQVTRVLATEYKLKPVSITEQTEIIGNIDLLIEMEINGNIETLPLDFKTGIASRYTPQDVRHNVQLNLYAWLLSQELDKPINFHGIIETHNGNWIITDRIRQVEENIITWLKVSQSKIENEEHSTEPSYQPAMYGSPCKHCSFLSICHPTYTTNA